MSGLKVKLVLLLSTSFVVLSTQLTPAYGKDAFDRGRELQQKGRFADAIIEYQKSLNDLKRSRKTRTVGTVFFNAIDKTLSIATFGDHYHVPQKPYLNDILDNTAITNCNLGVCYFAIDDLVQAEKYLRAALDYDACISNAHYYLGTILSLRGQYRDAIKEFEQEPLSDKSGDCQYQSAYCYDKLGLSKKARECRAKAAEINPKYMSYESVKTSIAELRHQEMQNREREMAEIEKERATEALNFQARMNKR